MSLGKFLLVATFLLLFSVVSAQAYTETFFLRANGNGIAPQTVDGAFGINDFNNPNNWGTDDKDDGKIGPNDRVIVLDDDGAFRPVNAGRRNSNLLTIQGSGLSGKPITIQGEAGGNPILLGSLSKCDSGNWTNEVGNLWKTDNGSFLVDPGFVLVGSESQSNVAIRQSDKKDLNADRKWWYDSTNDCVYLYNDGGNPAVEHKNIEIGSVERIIFAEEKNYITVKDLTLKYSARNAFWIESPDNWLIDSCTVKYGGGSDRGDTYDGNAITYYRGATNSIIRNCDVSQWNDICVCLEIGYSYENASNITFTNNTIDGCGGGIVAQIVSSHKGISIDNVLISRNKLTNLGKGWAGPTDSPAGFGIHAGSAMGADNEITNVTIIDNYIDTFAHSGISVGGGLGYNVQRNYITGGTRDATQYDTVGGIIIRGDPWPGVTGTFAYNVISNSNVPGIHVYGNDGAIKIYNNIIYKCGDTYKTTQDNTAVRFSNSDNYNFKNNVVVSKPNNGKIPYHALHINNKPSRVSLDNNIYYKASGDIIRYPLTTIYNTTEFLNYQTAINNEVNSIISDPLFTDDANKDFTLQPNSPAIDSGADTGLNKDFKGNPIVRLPDIGAYEYQFPLINPSKNARVVE